jgi:hypothetical protein
MILNGLDTSGKVFKINVELEVSFAGTYFTLRPNDLIFVNESNKIFKMGYYYDNALFSSNARVNYINLKTPTSKIRISGAPFTIYYDITRILDINILASDLIIDDITTSFNREEKLKLLFR